MACPSSPAADIPNGQIAGTSITGTCASARSQDVSATRLTPIHGSGLADSIPAAHPRECTSDTSETFDQARSEFEAAWAVFLSKRTEADFQEWRDQRDCPRATDHRSSWTQPSPHFLSSLRRHVDVRHRQHGRPRVRQRAGQPCHSAAAPMSAPPVGSSCFSRFGCDVTQIARSGAAIMIRKITRRMRRPNRTGSRRRRRSGKALTATHAPPSHVTLLGPMPASMVRSNKFRRPRGFPGSTASMRPP